MGSNATETLTIVLNADGSGLTGTIEVASGNVRRFGAVLDTTTGKVKEAGTASRRTAADVDALSQAEARSEARTRSLSSSMSSLRATLAGVGLMVVVKGLGRMADSYTDIDGKLRQVTASERELTRARADTLSIANQTFQSLDATVTLYSRGAQALEQYGVSQLKVSELTRTINQGLLVSRATTAESASAILQLSQALGAGALRGEEFNAVNEAAPRLMKALAESIGVPRGALKQLAEEGKLTVDVLMKAWTGDNARKIADEASQVPLTISRAWQVFRNNLTVYVGQADQAAGASRLMAVSIATLGANLATVMGLVVKFGTVAAIFYAGGKLSSGLKFLQALWVAQATVVNASMVSVVGLTGATTRLTVAQTAAAVASRGLASAVALLSANPIGVIIAAIGLVVADMWLARDAARAASEAIRSGIEDARAALDAFNRTPSLEEAFNLDPTKIRTAIQGAITELQKLKRERAELQADQGSWLFADPERLAEVTRQINLQTTDLRGLNEGWNKATDFMTDATATLMEVGEGNIYARAQIRELHVELLSGAITEEQANQRMKEIAVTHGTAAGAARINAAAVRDLSAATVSASGDFDNYAKSLNQLLVRLASARGGSSAALEMQIGQDINRAALAAGKGDRDKGIELLRASGELSKYGDTLKSLQSTTLEVEAAEKARSDATKGAAAATRLSSKETRDHTRDLERQKEALLRSKNEAELAAATLQGPLAEATARARIEQEGWRREMEAGNRTQIDFNNLLKESEAALAKRTAALQRDMAAPEALLDTMTGELRLLGMIGPARELYTRQLRNEADMRRELATAIEAAGSKELLALEKGFASYVDYEAAMVAAARANANLSMAIEDNASRLEEWAALATDLVGGVADVFTRLFTGQIKSSKDFFRSLKDVFKQGFADIVRTVMQQKLVEPFQRAIMGMFSGNGFGSAGQSGGGWMSMISNLFSGGQQSGGMISRIGQAFGFGGGSTATGSYASAAAANGGWGAFSPNVAGFNGAVPMSGASGGGGFSMPGGGGGLWTGEFAGGMPYASAALGLGGLYYGATQRGNGGLSSGVAALSYGAAGVAAGGAIAGGLGALGTAAGVGGMGAGAAAGATGAMASLGGAAWIPVVGWILAAMAVIDMVSGGKLFGTKYQLESSAATMQFGAEGISGVQEITQVRQRSLFRGRKWNTTEKAFDAETQAKLDDVFKQMNAGIAAAAQQIGVDAPGMVAASFRQEFDKKGNLKKEFGTIAGRVYEEAQEAFLSRLGSENLINVAMQAGNGAEINKLADPYRETPETLDEFAQFMLAVQTDIHNARALWEQTGPGMLTSIVETMERLGTGAETLLQTYQRINTAAMNYGNFIGGIDQQLRTADLNQYQRAQLDIELSYRDQIKQANELARAFGLSGARAEDLAKIEQLRALNMAGLQQQMERERDSILGGLSLSQYSPLTDAQKLSEAMTQLQAAVAAGDTNAASSLSQTALGFGRNLYASGSDYNALYDQVTGLIGSIAMPGLAMDDGTTMGDLADALLDLPRGIASELFALLINPPPSTPQTPPLTPPKLPPGTGSGDGTTTSPPGGGGSTETTNTLLMQILESQRRLTSELERIQLR